MPIDPFVCVPVRFVRALVLTGPSGLGCFGFTLAQQSHRFNFVLPHDQAEQLYESLRKHFESVEQLTRNN